MTATVMPKPVRILGIDPGLRHTGFGVIDVVDDNAKQHPHLSYIGSGSVHPSGNTLPERIATLVGDLQQVATGRLTPLR